jgi:uncharacterized Zn finger protein
VPIKKWPIVTCPGCRVAMDVKLVEPLDEADRVDNIVYQCPSCGTVTNRPTKRTQQSS